MIYEGEELSKLLNYLKRVNDKLKTMADGQYLLKGGIAYYPVSPGLGISTSRVIVEADSKIDITSWKLTINGKELFQLLKDKGSITKLEISNNYSLVVTLNGEEVEHHCHSDRIIKAAARYKKIVSSLPDEVEFNVEIAQPELVSMLEASELKRLILD